jgi:hypothetical protein
MMSRLDLARQGISSMMHRFVPWAAFGLTIGLFGIGGRPWAGMLFRGNAHWIAHSCTYALIGATYQRSAPRLSVWWVAIAVSTVGGLHELYEIGSHGHGFEVIDFLINAAGGILGVLLSWRYFGKSPKRAKT